MKQKTTRAQINQNMFEIIKRIHPLFFKQDHSVPNTCTSDQSVRVPGWQLQVLRESLNSCLSSSRDPVLLALVQHRAQGSNMQQVLLDSHWPCRKPALSPGGTLCCHSAAAELSLKQLIPTSQLSSKNTAAAKKLSQNKQGECQHK